MSELRLYNTLTRTKERFASLEGREVRIEPERAAESTWQTQQPVEAAEIRSVNSYGGNRAVGIGKIFEASADVELRFTDRNLDFFQGNV